MSKTLLLACLATLSGVVVAEPLSSGDFTVDLNPGFPGLLSYSLAGNAVTLPVPRKPVFLLNDQEFAPEVRLFKISADSAEYQLSFKELSVTMTARVAVSPDALTFTIADIRETGAFVVRTIEIPGLFMLAGAGPDEIALGNFPAASYASEKPEDHDIFCKVAELKDGDKNKNKDKNGNRGASYAFISKEKIAAGMYSNTMDENLRMIVRPDAQDAAGLAKTVSPGKWTWREIPTETSPAPQAKLVVAGDDNGDGKVNWQDAAIVYRKNTPPPYGGDKTRQYPIAYVAMNFGSQATNPFLRGLDNAKKIWLYTDGLGQRIQQKGFAGEGHDSSHPDYAGNVGRRQGGRDELNFMMRRGHDFNILSGIHINAHEYHKEAKAFNPEIANLNAVGWSWLDESYLTDYRYDSAYGTLYQRLDAMRADLPWLDFVYLDVYYGRGWPGWRMHSKVNSLGVMQFTEFPGVMERAVVWNHVANDWTQAVWGKGDRSEIARFIYYSQKDTFKHDPLLRGSNCDGFMGWHGERNMLQTVASAFNVNLPTKYLQHFQLIRQEPSQAWFDSGARTEVDGQAARLYGRDGQLINSCRYEKSQTRPLDNLTFIPWDPYTEAKIYHWNDKGGESIWTVPTSWKAVKTARLYRLTDLGRVFERAIPVVDGKVMLSGIAAKTPYVLYRETPSALPDMMWSEGSLARDAGFDSHSFSWWRKTVNPEAAAIENDAQYGQTELVFGTPAAGEVRQAIGGLKPGQTYAASVWVNIDGERDAGLTVETDPAIAPFIDRLAWKPLASSTKTMGGSSVRNLFDGNPKSLWHTTNAKPEPAFPHEFGIDFGSTLGLDGFVLTAREDRGNGTIKGYEVWTGPDQQNWEKVASGEFTYGADNRATVKFGRTVPARCFRLVSISEIKNQPFSSAAELELILAKGQASELAPGITGVAASKTLVATSVRRTTLINFTDQSSKYMRPWHRMKVVFTAPADGRVALRLQAGVGANGASVRFDDVRLVKTGVSQPPKDARNVVLFEDFENVDEAWGPFMYGWQGPMNTHLSEVNPPYTDDTIGGEFSLKSRREGTPDMVYRTVPATLKLMPNTTYRVSFDYLCDTAEVFAFTADSDEGGKEQKDLKAFLQIIPDGSWKVQRLSATFKTDARPGWFIGVTKVAGKKKEGTLVIDNVLVEEIPEK